MLNIPIDPNGAGQNIPADRLTKKIYSADSEVLREMFNIGMGHASTSFSQMLGRKVSMSPPKLLFLPSDRFVSAVMGENSEPYICYGLRLQGSAKGHIVHMFGEKFASEAINSFFMAGIESISQIDEMMRSVIQEISNITSGGFCNAVASMTDEFVDISIPQFYQNPLDFMSEIVSSSPEEDLIFAMESSFISGETNASSRFLFVPDNDTVYLLYSKFKKHSKVSAANSPLGEIPMK